METPLWLPRGGGRANYAFFELRSQGTPHYALSITHYALSIERHDASRRRAAAYQQRISAE